MIRRLLWAIAVSIACLPIIATAQSRALETKLLPEVAQIVLHSELPDEAILKQDVYVGLLGIEAPEGTDYMAIGSQITLHNFNKRDLQNFGSWIPPEMLDRDKLLRLSLDENGEKYLFSCADIHSTQCVIETLSQSTTVSALLERNALLMKRYLEVRELPNYGGYLYGVADFVPSYSTVLHLTNMRLARALNAFDEGEVNEGLTLLEAEMAFTKRMLAEEQTLIGQMIAIRQLYTLYHTVSEAMELPQVKEMVHSQCWAALLAPLTLAEQQGMAQALMTERNAGLHTYYSIGPEAMDLVGFDGERAAASYQAKENFRKTYDRDETCNISYLMYEPLIQRASLPLEEVARLKAMNKLEDISIAMEDIRNAALAKNTNMLSNYIGKTLLEFASPDVQGYLNRRYDLQVYLSLVQVKHQIIKEGIKKEDVPAFLTKINAHNPYTQEALEWDAETGTLHTPWLNTKTGVSQGTEKMSVRVF